MPTKEMPPVPRRVRWASGLAAVSTTAVLSAALLGAWHGQAEPIWLVATPELLAQLKDCDALARRPDRVRCQQALVAAWLPAELRAVRLAAR